MGQVVAEHARQTQRYSEEAGSLRRQNQFGGVSAADDLAQAQQSVGAQAEFLDHHFVGAEWPAMAPENALDIKGRRAEALSDRKDFRGSDE